MNVCIAKKMLKDIVKALGIGVGLFFGFAGLGWIFTKAVKWNPSLYDFDSMSLWNYSWHGFAVFCAGVVVIVLGAFFSAMVIVAIVGGLMEWYKTAKSSCKVKKKKKRRK